MITVVVTSYNRFDLLERTISSFLAFNTYPIEKIIIIDDSGDKSMHRKIKKSYPYYHLILNNKNIGLIDSIDLAYSHVTSKYIFHTEDDFEYRKSGFIEKSIKLMEADPMICRVGIRGQRHLRELNNEVIEINGVEYREPKPHPIWFGFGFQCGLISKSAYDTIKPYSKYSMAHEFITIRECRIGIAYHDLGFKAVSLLDDYCIHTGSKRSTYGLKMEG